MNYADPSGHNWEWGSFWKGLGYLATGIGAIVAGTLVLASGVASVPMLIIAGVTLGAGALTAINGASEIIEAGTGYNFVEDSWFGGNSTAYNTYATITGTVATIGSLACGGWYKHNIPRVKAYNGISNYNFSQTLSDPVHMARPYQQSLLLQKQIIKYGKMVSEGNNIYNFTIGGTFQIGWLPQITHIHEVTWKVVVDIAGKLILHAGL